LARLQGWQLPYPTNGWTPVFALLALVPALGGAAAGAVLRALITSVRVNLRTLAIVLVLSTLTGAAVFQGIQAVGREPAVPVARLQHDPWQAFARNMDINFFMFRKGNLSADELQNMRPQLVASPTPEARTIHRFDGREKPQRQPRDVSRDPNWNHTHRGGLAAE
jgi:hypothetical protein